MNAGAVEEVAGGGVAGAVSQAQEDIVARLRRETAEDHAAVEGSMPLMREGLTRAEYVAVLRRMHGVVAAWEDYAAEHAPDWLLPMLQARARKPLLEADLSFFGCALPDGERPEVPAWPAEALPGPAYVMEGSRLGGLLMAKFVEGELGLAAGVGDSYFRSRGVEVKPRWQELLAQMRLHVSPENYGAVVVAAKQMFQLFGGWMRGTLPPER